MDPITGLVTNGDSFYTLGRHDTGHDNVARQNSSPILVSNVITPANEYRGDEVCRERGEYIVSTVMSC